MKTDQFTSTQWATADEKAKWAKKFIRFVEGGFKAKAFTKPIYDRLSNMFHHIAHFNRTGFYSVWFTTEQQRRAFMKRLREHTPMGDPAHTWSDVERALQAYFKANPTQWCCGPKKELHIGLAGDPDQFADDLEKIAKIIRTRQKKFQTTELKSELLKFQTWGS